MNMLFSSVMIDRSTLSFFTKVEEAVEFVERTKVDCLAVVVGTVHGLEELTGQNIIWKIIENRFEGMDEFAAYASSVEKNGPSSIEPCDGLLEEIKDVQVFISMIDSV